MVNKVILLGNVGKDPEMKQFDSGPITKVSLATSEKYTNKSGEKVEKTEWHNLNFFGKTAELVTKWVKKGDSIYVEGKLETREYDKDGQKHFFTSVNCDTIKFVNKKNQSSVPEQNKPAPVSDAPNTAALTNAPADEFGDDGLPF